MQSELNKFSEHICTFKYQKTLFHTLLLLIFKTVESHQCILKATLERLKLSTSEHFNLLGIYPHWSCNAAGSQNKNIASKKT